MHMENCKPVVTTVVKSKYDPADTQPLSAADAFTFRRCVGIVNYLAPDRLDIAYACKELGRWQKEPVVAAATVSSPNPIDKLLATTSSPVVVNDIAPCASE